MTIERIDQDLPLTTKIKLLNDMIIELNGLIAQGKFDINELDYLYSILPTPRKFKRNIAIGNTSSTYLNWSHLQAETGYSIWKFTPTNYTYNALNKLYMNDKVLENRGEASSETATTFDSVFLYNGDSGSGYVDNSSEAGSATGTAFAVNNTTRDYLYLGSSTKFSGAKFEWQTRGSNYTLVVEYWSGSAWLPLSVNTDNLEDGTNNFQSDGHISWTTPSNWSTLTVNSSLAYWIRISSTTDPITVAQAYYIIPKTSVIGLLALSNDEIINEEWAWCSYSGNIYVTIRNRGSTSSEGSTYITSSSSSANKLNFFVYNNPFTADYENSTLNTTTEVSTTTALTTMQRLILANAVTNITLTLPPAHTNDGMIFVIKKVNSTNTVTIETESGETIDGAGNKTLTTQYTFYWLISDNGNWHIIGS